MQIWKISRRVDPKTLHAIARALTTGKVLVLPTDTVYGLVCNAKNAKAVERIFLIKKRGRNKPLGVFVANIAMAKRFARVRTLQEQFLKKAWPGKLTAVLESKNKLPKTLNATKTLGMRAPKHVLLQYLLQKVGGPLVQTSVNISNAPPLHAVRDMVALFSHRKHRPDIIVDAGTLKRSRPSRVVDITHAKPKILRT